MTGYPLPFDHAAVAALLERSVDVTAEPGSGGPVGRLDDTVTDLRGLGLPAGTPLIIARSNGRALLELYFGALLAGLVPVLASPATPAARIAALARTTAAGAVIGARPDPHRYGGTAVRTVGAARAVVLAHPDPPGYRPGSVVMLTSGTSGMVSGCVHRADALARNAARHAAAVGLRAGDTVLVTLPLHYSYAIVAQAFAALVTGQRLVISGPPFAPAAYREVIGRHGVTVSSVTPTIARLLLADPRPLPAGLRTLTVGGDRLAPAQVGALLAANPGLELYLTYGLTEAGPRVATLAAHAEPAYRHASAGLPLPGVRTALRPVPGRAGATELLVTSDTVLLRRVGRPGPDHTLVGPDTVATGDLFRADADGYLFHEGRLSDFAILRGEKVCLAAVRQLVETVPGVVRCTTVIAEDASHFDLDVRVTATGGPAPAEADLAAAEQRVRAAVAAYLLPGERPRRITVGPPNLAAFHK